MKRRALISIVLGAVCVPAVALGQPGPRGIAPGQPQATLPVCVPREGPIFDFDVRAYIARHIPACSPKLLIMTQCYGGDFLNDFAGTANTTVLTAGQPGRVVYYRGYHDDAARGLRPGPGRTARDVHNDGVGGKDARETPKTGGTVPPGGFSLEPITPTSAVQSRHVLVYAGKPNALDNADRDAIIGNFAGQPNTTVNTVGARGAADGYQRPASHAGLAGALRDIGAMIRNSPDPCREQFIFFVTDHGDIHRVQPLPLVVLPPLFQATIPFESMVTGFDCLPADLVNDPDNLTSFSLFVPLAELQILHDPIQGPLWPPGSLQAGFFVGPSGLVVPEHHEFYNDLGSGIIGDEPGEGAWLTFAVPEALFVDSFFDVFMQVALVNGSNRPVALSAVSQDAGVIQRPPGANPCPADFNNDGNVDPDDLSDFITCFFGQVQFPGLCPEADFNSDGNVDPDDLADYITTFFGPPC